MNLEPRWACLYDIDPALSDNLALIAASDGERRTSCALTSGVWYRSDGDARSAERR